MSELKILLVDHNELFRRGLAMLINNQPGMKIVAHCGDVTTALANIGQLKPDIALVAADLPGQGSIELVRAINKESLGGGVLALANKFDAITFRNLMKHKAKGYVLKSASMSALITAIHTVAAGKVYLDPEIVTDCLDQVFIVSDATSEPRIKQLSQREEMVLRLWAKGSTTKQIAEQLKRSVKTVDTMRFRAFAKLGLRNRSEVINYALKEDWLSETGTFNP